MNSPPLGHPISHPRSFCYIRVPNNFNNETAEKGLEARNSQEGLIIPMQVFYGEFVGERISDLHFLHDLYNIDKQLLQES